MPASSPHPKQWCILFKDEAERQKKNSQLAINEADLVGIMDGKFIRVVKSRVSKVGTIKPDDWATLVDRTEADHAR
jgi:hypothetical protein